MYSWDEPNPCVRWVSLDFLLAACQATEPDLPSIPGDSPKRVPGIIAYYDEPTEINLPDTVTHGERLSVDVMTYGGWLPEKGDVEVEVTGLEATIRPYDLDTTPPDGLCSSELLVHTHTADVRFVEAGQAQIRVMGVREGPESPAGVDITATRTLEVC